LEAFRLLSGFMVGDQNMINYDVESHKIVNFMDKNNIKNGCDELFPYWNGIEHGVMTFEQFLKEWKRISA